RVARTGVRAGAIDLLENHRSLDDPQSTTTVLGRDENRQPSGIGECLDEGLGVGAFGLDPLPVVTPESPTQLANRFAVLGVHARTRIDLSHPSPWSAAATSALSPSERTVS